MSAVRKLQLPVDDSPGSALTDADYGSLNRRWIDNDLADAARIRRVDSDAGRSLVGRSDYGSYEGLAIPYFLPGEVHVREWRLRRDHPDMEVNNGKLRERGKYLSPPGRKNMLYFPPGVSQELVKAGSVPVIVAEGEFKALALWRLANHESDSPRFLPLGLSGAWNWRGTIGKTTGPNGDRRDVKGAIPDLDLVTWEGWPVIIAFDADADKNEHLEIARTLFTRELRMRGGKVAVVSWDITQGKGIDDLLANIGPEKVLELIEGADFEKEESEENVSIHQIAAAIKAKHWFAQDLGGRLYVFRGGSYHANGAAFVRQQVKQLLERMRLSSKWTSHKAEEVVKYIEIDAPRLWDQPKVDVVNVLNGLLDATTWVLLPHSPDFLSPVQLPVKFDPNARCPTWEKFVSETFPTDAQAIAWEILAWLMTPDTSIQKAILLLGDGANGKSTYLRGVLAFIGKSNAAALSLHKLETDRFSVARLVGKLTNICPDLPSTELTSTSIFKAITGGDALSAEYKFKDSFEFIAFARLIFSTNHLPKSHDASPAFFRRWTVVPFDRTFAEGTPGTIPRDKLDGMLSEASELSGVLNKAHEVLVTLRTRGFSESESTRRAADEFRQATDPLAVWLDRKTMLRSDAVTPQDQLFGEYCRVCMDLGRPTITKTAFGRSMKQLRPSVADYQRTVNGQKLWCYIGIALQQEDGE